MADAGTRRYNAETAERLLTPAQEYVALVVALHLQTDVFFKGIVVTEMIDGNGVVDDQIDG